jgi:hypothetical protein
MSNVLSQNAFSKIQTYLSEVDEDFSDAILCEDDCLLVDLLSSTSMTCVDSLNIDK